MAAASSAGMHANILFINIDWKDSRHNTKKSTERNLLILSETIEDVVYKMNPAMICMCEVGSESKPLTQRHMEQVRDQVVIAWERVTIKHVSLQSMFEIGRP